MAFQPPGTAKCSARALLPHKLNVSFVAAYSSAGRTPGSSPHIVVRTSCQGSERHDTRARRIKLVMRFAASSCGDRSRVVSQFLEPAAVRSAAASFCLVRGGRQVLGAPAWSARSGLLLVWSTKVNNTSGTLRTLPLPPTLMPNPSLKLSPNGRPPAPARRYAVHFRQSGPGVLPSVPA